MKCLVSTSIHHPIVFLLLHCVSASLWTNDPGFMTQKRRNVLGVLWIDAVGWFGTSFYRRYEFESDVSFQDARLLRGVDGASASSGSVVSRGRVLARRSFGAFGESRASSRRSFLGASRASSLVGWPRSLNEFM